MPNSKIKKILNLIKEINDHYYGIFGSSKLFFRDTHLVYEDKSSYEFRFVFSVSWFCSLFLERGYQNFSYINTKLDFRGITGIKFINELRSVRTYYQHSLDPSKRHDSDVISTVENFFDTILDTSLPKSDSHWENSLDKLIDNVLVVLKQIKLYLKELASDPDIDTIKLEWENYVEQKIDIETTRGIFRKLCNNLSLDFFDANLICQKYYEHWMSELQMMKNHSPDQTKKNLETIIQNKLLSYEYLPINGNDIMEYCSIKEGKQIRNKLEKARKLFKKNPCNKKTLLQLIC